MRIEAASVRKGLAIFCSLMLGLEGHLSVLAVGRDQSEHALAPTSPFAARHEESAMNIILKFLEGMRRKIAEFRLTNAAFLLLDMESGQVWALGANQKRLCTLGPLDPSATGLLEYAGKPQLFFPLRGLTFAERLAVIFVAAEKDRAQSLPLSLTGPILKRRTVLDWGMRMAAALAWGDTGKVLSLVGSAAMPSREEILKLGKALAPTLTRLQQLKILRPMDSIRDTGAGNFMFTGFWDDMYKEDFAEKLLSEPMTSADISAQAWADDLCAKAMKRGAQQYGWLKYLRDQILMSRNHPQVKRNLLEKFLKGFNDEKGEPLISANVLKAVSYDPGFMLPTVIVSGHGRWPSFERDLEDLEYIALSWDVDGHPPVDVEDIEKYARREIQLAHKMNVPSMPILPTRFNGPWKYLSWAMKEYGGITPEEGKQLENIIGLFHKLAARSASLDPSSIEDLGVIIRDLEKALQTAPLSTVDEEAADRSQEKETGSEVGLEDTSLKSGVYIQALPFGKLINCGLHDINAISVGAN